MKVKINSGACCLCEGCSDNCPEVFEMIMASGSAKIKEDVLDNGKIPLQYEEKVKQVAKECAGDAIRILNETI